MKDDKGLYYYPFPNNKRVRMYVRPVGSQICFRLWNADDPILWEKHGWMPYEAILQASSQYQKKQGGIDPNRAYDIEAAKALIREEAMGR
jgi:hypothetical protein